MGPKDFLLHELENVGRTLQETLRHDYPPGSGSAFYKECLTRLERLTKDATALNPADVAGISDHNFLVSRLSHLISLIERSHLGEFSWPFAERLRHIAAELCKEPGPSGNLTPIIHILSDGGLDAYCIYTESYWPGPRLNRILNIVFPRTLKHHVMLHAIFGHEIGHAAWAIPMLQAPLQKDVITPLFAGTVLETDAKAEVWLNDPTRPANVMSHQARWDSQQPHPISFIGANNPALLSWQQEFFCDLFGTVLFGPSFAGAEQVLLGSPNPTGEFFSDTHPPFAARALLISKILRKLGWLTYGASGNASLDAAIVKAAAFMTNTPSADKWYDIFSDAQVNPAVDGLVALMKTFPAAKALYAPPTIDRLAAMIDLLSRRVPPCGADLQTNGKPSLSALDFRQVLYAGWVLWNGRDDIQLEKKLDFFHINQLCDRGMMQDFAVELSQ